MANGGYITIGTKLETDKFDKQIASLEKKVEQLEKKDIEITTQETSLKQTIANFEKLRDEVLKYEMQLKKLKDLPSQEGPVRAGPYLTALMQQETLYKQSLASMKEQSAEYQNAISKLQQLNGKHQELNDKVTEYKQKIESVKIQKQADDVKKLKDGFNSVGNSIQGAVKKAGALALGIFGIRSAYLALRRASSDLATYDKQYATNLEYIRFVLTQMVAPVLKWIVNMAMRLLQIIGMIVNALFGVNIFSRGSAENFKKMKAGASGVGKAVKEIKKQLLGFDEVNILTDQSDTGTSGGAGGVGMPDFDLSELEGETPEWLKWIVDHKDLLLAIFAGILAFLTALKLGLGIVKALGIGLIVAGIVYAIQGLLEYLKNPTWENFGKILQGIGVALIGLGIILGGTAGLIAGVVGVFILGVGTIIKYWDQIKMAMQSVIDYIRQNWGPIGDFIADIMQGVLDTFDIVFNYIKNIFDAIIQIITGVFTGDWSKAWEGIKNIFIYTWDAIKAIIKVFAEFLYNIAIKPAINIFNSLWNAIKSGAESAWNWITGIFGAIGNWFSNLINTIIGKFRDMGARVGEVVSGAFKGVVNGILGAVERILNVPIRAINGLIGVINAVPGVNLNRLSTFNLPRLKAGGIINMPNKGTMVGSAIGGESGREGVVPLTDQQAMAELGREIGKNVLVNLTNITQMNGRVISRELKQVQSTQKFAYNL